MSKFSLSPIEHKDIASIREYANNAKNHPKEQVKQIVKSITEFGFLDPISVDESNVILEGHGRLAAAKELKLTSVPVIQILGLTEAQKTAYRIAHNKITLSSGFNQEALLAELEALIEFNYDIAFTGFDPSKLDELLQSLNDEPKAEIDQDLEKKLTMITCPHCGENFSPSKKQ